MTYTWQWAWTMCTSKYINWSRSYMNKIEHNWKNDTCDHLKWKRIFSLTSYNSCIVSSIMKTWNDNRLLLMIAIRIKWFSNQLNNLKCLWSWKWCPQLGHTPYLILCILQYKHMDPKQLVYCCLSTHLPNSPSVMDLLVQH